MKNIKQTFKTLILLSAAILLFAGCEKEAPTGLAVEYIPKKITTEGGTLSFTVYPGTISKWAISFLDNQSVKPSASWIELSQSSGSGETTVTVTIRPNESAYEREIALIVTAGDRDIPIKIAQEGTGGYYFRVLPETLNDLPPDEGVQYISRSLEVEANVSWYAKIVTADTRQGDWTVFLPDHTSAYGDASAAIFGNDTLDLHINNYNTIGAPSREAKIQFFDTSGELLKEVPVTQNAPAIIFEVNPESLLNLPPDEGVQYIARSLEVTANISWYAEIVSENNERLWIMFLPDNVLTYGDAATPVFGNDTIDLSIGNYVIIGAPVREAKVRFYNTSGELLKEVPVTQNAPAIIFEVNPESLLNLPPDEGVQYIARSLEVTANISWYAQIVETHGDPDLDSWCLFLPDYTMTHGSAASPAYGNAVLDLFISNHEDVEASPRETKIRFYNTDGELLKEVPISQNPPVAIFEVTPESYLDLPPVEGGNFIARNLEVTANIGWYAQIEIIPDGYNTGYWIVFLPEHELTLGSTDLPRWGDETVQLHIDNYYATTAVGPTRVAKVRFYNTSGVQLKEIQITQNSQ